MATSLTISTPMGEETLHSALTSADDAAAQAILVNFAYATGANEESPPQVLLDHVAAQLAQYMQSIARERYIQRMSATIRTEAEENVHW